jgi:hypothetical protein
MLKVTIAIMKPIINYQDEGAGEILGDTLRRVAIDIANGEVSGEVYTDYDQHCGVWFSEGQLEVDDRT